VLLVVAGVVIAVSLSVRLQVGQAAATSDAFWWVSAATSADSGVCSCSTHPQQQYAVTVPSISVMVAA
jgi:hypothetical protein